jgi:hypothetical protein
LHIYRGIIEQPERIEVLNEILNELNAVGFGKLVHKFCTQTDPSVKLLYEAFPYQQFGVKCGVLRWISPSTSTTEFRAIVDLNDETIMVSGNPAPLKVGMGGRADIVLAKRSLLNIAFDPTRQLRENMASPPSRTKQ